MALRNGSLYASEVCSVVILSNAEVARCSIVLGSSCRCWSRISHLHAAKTLVKPIMFTQSERSLLALPDSSTNACFVFTYSELRAPT